MAGIRRDVVCNPVVNEYLYDNMIKSSYEQRRGFSGRYRRAFVNSKSARRFATKSTLEEKAIVLAKLGIPFAWAFNLSKQKLSKLFDEHGGGTANEVTKAMMEENILVVTARQIMEYLGLMASNANGETWMLNRDFFTAGYKIPEFRKILINPENNLVRESRECSKEVARLMYDTILCNALCDNDFGIPENSMLILLHFYTLSAHFIAEEELQIKFKPVFGLVKTGIAIKRLVEAKLIEKTGDSSVRRKKFFLTGLGSDTVLKFQKRIFNFSKFT